ncbi:FMN-binding negative transcriptional regulator (plasmid) [Tistrella mobilis]|uniref:FMN-binding negative transcriptional regulator n=1 Tax=Tistrella mobilis TaxID=171437 RepID=UPI003558BC28
MYVPAHYRTDDPAAILGWLARFPFGTLVTTGADGLPLATSLPVITEDRGITEDQATDDITGLTIAAHMARRNPHAAALSTGMPALLVVNGPDAYISPAWYESPVNVPTWDYVGLQIRGRLTVIDDRDDLLDLMRRQIAAFEARTATGWTLDAAPEAHVDRLIQGVVGLRIQVERIDCMQKLSQNKPTDRPTIQAALRASGSDYGPVVAGLMDLVR